MRSEVFEADVKNRIALKKTCIAMTELVKSISTWMGGTITETIF